jgi:putative transposase
MIDQAIGELAPVIGTAAACAALGQPRAVYYRRHRQSPRPPRTTRERRRQPRALTEAERGEVLGVLHDERFVDQAPASIYAMLLDEGRYVCSVPTMYRLLRAEGEVRERRRQATHPATVKPELVATGPNQIWSWDITKLHGPEKWTYFHLYVRDHRHLQPLRTGLAIGYPRNGRVGRALPGRDHPQAPRGCRPTHDPRRSGYIDGLQAGGAPAG